MHRRYPCGLQQREKAETFSLIIFYSLSHDLRLSASVIGRTTRQGLPTAIRRTQVVEVVAEVFCHLALLVRHHFYLLSPIPRGVGGVVGGQGLGKRES